MTKRISAISLTCLLAISLVAAAQHPRDKDIRDPDTKAWWHTTEFLSSDAMEGRDTGSAACARAAGYVAARMLIDAVASSPVRPVVNK